MRDNTLQRIKSRIQFNLTMAQIYLRDINFKTFEHVFLFTSLILLDFECHLFRKYDTSMFQQELWKALWAIIPKSSKEKGCRMFCSPSPFCDCA